VHRVLAENAPKGKAGRKGKGEISASMRQFSRCGGRKKTVLSVRLAQEHPAFYDAYLRGDYKTVTAEATAAGICVDKMQLLRGQPTAVTETMTDEQRDARIRQLGAELGYFTPKEN
jgi:hypothetical protein